MNTKNKLLIATLLLISSLTSTGTVCENVAEKENVSFEVMKQEINEKSLPLVNINVNIESVTKADYTQATIEIVDLQKRTDGENVSTTMPCKVKYRGASSLAYDKKSFAVKLLDEKGKSLDATILGIRKDDAWILDAMAVDRIRMRNRLNFDIWNVMSQTPYATKNSQRNGTKGEFVELFINNEYHGLYCMSDKVNRKLLEVTKFKEDKDNGVTINGVIYKCGQWGDGAALRGYDDTQSMESTSWNCWELDYPDDYPCAEAYTPLKELIDFCAQTSDKDFKEGFNKHFYLQNFIDYHLFICSFGLWDNTMKNSFLSIVNTNNDKQQALITPWDLDCSLGGSWNGDRSEGLYTPENMLNVKPYGRMWNGDIDGYRQKVAERWKELYNGILSEQEFNQRIESYCERIVNSGAWEREYNKWNNNPVELKADLKDEVDYVKDWYKSNINNLESKYFGNIESDITNINMQRAKNTRSIHNLAGQRVSENYKGMVITDGRVIVKK